MTAAHPSQTDLYGEILTNEQRYHVELAACPDARTMTREEEDHLTERARMGEASAWETLVLALLPRIERYARRCLRHYTWASQRIEYLDLVQEGNIAAWSCRDLALRCNHSAFAYATAVAYQKMNTFIKCFTSAIMTPDEPGFYPIAVESLERPHKEGRTLFDLLSETPMKADDDVRTEDTSQDYMPLYEAVNALRAQQKHILIRHYGLYGQPCEPLAEIERDMDLKRTLGYRTEDRALMKLASLLAPIYPHYCSKTRNTPLRDTTTPLVGELTAQQEQRLSHAYTALTASGQPITKSALAREAGMGKHTRLADMYLRVHAVASQPKSREERLDEAYAHLQNTGQPITGRRLAAAARVDTGATNLYLHNVRGAAMRTLSERPMQERLDEAYAAVQSQGRTVTVRALAKIAHADEHAVRTYLRQRAIEGTHHYATRAGKGGITTHVSNV